MLVTFLFWNLMKRPLEAKVARIVATHAVDMVLLPECVNCDAMLDAIRGVDPAFTRPDSRSKKIQLLTRFDPTLMEDLFNDPVGGTTIRHLRIGPHPGVILVGLHFPSRVNWDQGDQALEATVLAKDIAEVENRIGTTRTILVGDLNMNPFDPGVVGAHALHSVMTKTIAAGRQRDVRLRPYRFFYNPMWSLLGDRSEGPAGTFFLRSSKPTNFFWNMYDQVLLRPDLMHGLRELAILDSDGESSLVTLSGQPKISDGSDHLPLLFQLDL